MSILGETLLISKFYPSYQDFLSLAGHCQWRVGLGPGLRCHTESEPGLRVGTVIVTSAFNFKPELNPQTSSLRLVSNFSERHHILRLDSEARTPIPTAAQIVTLVVTMLDTGHPPYYGPRRAKPIRLVT